MTFKLVVDPMVPNPSKVGKDRKSEKIEQDSIECQTINGPSTIFNDWTELSFLGLDYWL